MHLAIQIIQDLSDYLLYGEGRNYKRGEGFTEDSAEVKGGDFFKGLHF